MEDLKSLLDFFANKYNDSSFIVDDPICIPHSYSLKQDIEITAFWTAILAWGQRKTIINKSKELFNMMDNRPYDFILNHKPADLKPFEKFKHRTFQPDDTLYFIEFLKHHYTEHRSLESAFIDTSISGVEAGLNHFRKYFFAAEDHLRRTEKHISAPSKKSTCKRLCMFLRWMVRKDDAGVDFGIWNQIRPAELFIPLDVHVDRVARKFKLLDRKQRDWRSVVELTENLRKIDPQDPVKYDFALFGYGVGMT